jgi:N-acetylneuraminic acid mutarotase
MKTKIAITLIMLFAFLTNQNHIKAQNTWQQITPTGDIPTARQGHSMVSIDSLVYLFGGQDGSKSILNIIYSFDPNLQEWNEETPINTPPPPRHGHKAIVRDGRMYVFFGTGDSGAMDDIWQYDPSTKEWTQIISSSTNNPVARYDHTTNLLGNMVWIMGGLDNDGNPLSDLWAYNFSSSQWEDYPDLMETALNGHVAAQNNGRLYFFGGYGGMFINNSVYEYFLGNNSWTEHSPIGVVPYPFAYGTLVQYGENIAYIFSGEMGENQSIVHCYKWDLLTNSFIQILDGPDVSYAAAALCPHGSYDKSNYEKFVVFGGDTDGVLTANTWIYTSDIIFSTSINEVEQIKIKVYPNPTQDFITIEISDKNLQSQELNYQLCDITGRIIVSGKISSSKEFIDVSREAAGMYFIRICNGNKMIEIIKTIKE